MMQIIAYVKGMNIAQTVAK